MNKEGRKEIGSLSTQPCALDFPGEVEDVFPDCIRQIPLSGVHVGHRAVPDLGIGQWQIDNVASCNVAGDNEGSQHRQRGSGVLEICGWVGVSLVCLFLSFCKKVRASGRRPPALEATA